MAENQLPAGKKWVYQYDTELTTHPFQLRLMVDKDDPIMSGQTDVPVPDDNKTYYWNDITKQWVDSTVMVYGINPDMSFGPMTKHPAGYTLQANETFKKPQDGVYDPSWNGSDWVGISAEEWLKKLSTKPAKPTQQETAMIALGQQVGSLIAENQTLKTQLEKNAQATQALGELVAPLVAKQNASQGGN